MCSVEGCELAIRAGGYCQMHLSRIRRDGVPGSAKPKFIRGADLLTRLGDKFTVGDGCWEWTAQKNHRGYGLVYFQGRDQVAMRLLYELMIGPIPEGLVLDHFACENTGCVRPSHVRPVTQRENILRGNGVTAWNRAKTHCKWGHEFTEENTRHDAKSNGRVCRTCVRERARRYAAAKKA